MQAAAFKDAALDVLLFPVWWYSRGLVLMLRWCANTFVGYVQYLAIGIWIKNIFVPMFGQRDWQSRLISVFMRSVQIVGRGIALAFIACGIALVFVFYLIAPISVTLFGVFHLLGSIVYAV